MPPPLPLPPITAPPPPPRRPARWPGLVALAAALFALTALLTYGLRRVDEVRAASLRTTGTEQVRAVLDAQAAAWNAGDLDGFMAGYWADEGLRFYSGGTVTTGWQATLDRYRKRYQADGKEMGKLTFTELEVEPLAADAALARGRWGLVLSKSEEKPNGLFTLILRKTADGWKVVHDHTSAADPPK